MLPNHAPMVVAEQFALLEAAYPGRIDLGIGRAPGTDPVTRYALRHGAGGVDDNAVEQFPTYVDDVLAMMSPDGVGMRIGGGSTSSGRHPPPVGVPQIWLLGSSDYSARLAAEKGMPYVFAHHFSGKGTAEALELYRVDLPTLTRARRAAHLPHRQRGGRADPRGGRAARAAQPAADACAPDRPAAGRPAHRRAGRGGRGVARAGSAQPHRRDGRRGWVIDEPVDGAGAASPIWRRRTTSTR